jgi:hypothetical protein
MVKPCEVFMSIISTILQNVLATEYLEEQVFLAPFCAPLTRFFKRKVATVFSLFSSRNAFSVSSQHYVRRKSLNVQLADVEKNLTDLDPPFEGPKPAAMDPVSVACGVLAGLHALRRTVQGVMHLRQMPKELQELRREVDDTAQVVQDMMKHLGSSDAQAGDDLGSPLTLLCSTLVQIQEHVQAANSLLGTFIRSKTTATGSVPKMDRLMWLLNLPIIKEHSVNLNRSKLRLLCVCSSMSMSVSTPLLQLHAHQS